MASAASCSVWESWVCLRACVRACVRPCVGACVRGSALWSRVSGVSPGAALGESSTSPIRIVGRWRHWPWRHREISGSLGSASAVAITCVRGSVLLITHPASAGDGAHTHSHHLLGFSAALAPKFTHSLAGLGFADGVVFHLPATAGSARDRRAPQARQGSPGLPGLASAPPASPGLPRAPPSAVYPPIGLAWNGPKT